MIGASCFSYHIGLVVSYTTSDMQRFDNHCESHSALEVVHNAPIAIRYRVTGALNTKGPVTKNLRTYMQCLKI